MKVESILARLDNVKPSTNGYTARCPTHEDKHNSLAVSQGENGGVVLKCFAGCETAAVVAAMGLSLSDLMPESDNWKDSSNDTVYRVNLPGGGYVEHVRIETPNGKKFTWRRDGQSGLNGMKVADLPLYRPVIQGKDYRITICEGEKAAIAAARIGLKAYGTMSGAASCPGKAALSTVCKCQEVLLWADNDEPGHKHMAKVKAALAGIAKTVVVFSTGEDKDDAADYNGDIKSLETIILKASGKRFFKTSTIAENTGAALAALGRYSSGDNSDRIPWGIKKCDSAMRGGMLPGALYLLGAPSGHGKTTLLQSIGFHCARERGPVLFCSPEMSGAELAEREIIKMSGEQIGNIGPWQNPVSRIEALGKMELASEKIRDESLPIHVVEETDITMMDIREIAKDMKTLSLIIVDYAQEIADRAATARYLAVGEVGKAAIILGKEFKVPVLVASQVNVGRGEGGVLDYSFRETKDLEHRAHASLIMEVKRSKEPNNKGFYDVVSTRIFARKNRSGAVFSVDVNYQPELFKIGDINAEYWTHQERRGDY